MWYGQVVIGPPGSGKSSYCFGMQQMLSALERRHIVINLDPMNDLFPYKCDIDIMDLVKGDDIMKTHKNPLFLFMMVMKEELELQKRLLKYFQN